MITTSGVLPVVPDKRDRSFAGTFGDLAFFPDSYNADAGFSVPDQNALGFPNACFPTGTRILSEDFSYKNIEDIAVGDVVFTHLGNKKRVLKKYKRYYQGKVTTLKLQGDFREIISTPEHPYFVVRRVRRYRSDASWIKNKDHPLNIIVLPAKDLQKRDYVVFPKFIGQSKDVSLHTYETNPDFLLTLGLYLAEGHTGERWGTIFDLHAKEDYLAKKVISAMTPFGGVVSTYIRKGQNTSRVVYIKGNQWNKVFGELGGHMCYAKKISDRIMNLDPKLLMNVVDGFIAGDGYKRNRSKSGSTCISADITSYELLEQIRLILQRNGIFSCFSKRKDREGRLPSWALEYIENPHHTRYLQDTENIYVPVISVKTPPINTYRFDGNVYNLEVEDDNSYIVNNVAVHNCTGFCQSELCADEDKINYDPIFTYDKVRFLEGTDGQNVGADVRDSLKTTILFGVQEKDKGDAQNHRRGAYYAVDKTTDYFDGVRSAMLKYQHLWGKPCSVSFATRWYHSFNQTGADGIVQTPDYKSPFSYHNYKCSGWKTIGGVPYLVMKPWTGKDVADGGFYYFRREIVNALLDQYFSGAFVLAPFTGDYATIRLTAIEQFIHALVRVGVSKRLLSSLFGSILNP